MRHSAGSQPSASLAVAIPEGQAEKISSWNLEAETNRGAPMRSSSQGTQATSLRRSQKNKQPVLNVLPLSSLFVGLPVGGIQLEAKQQGSMDPIKDLGHRVGGGQDNVKSKWEKSGMLINIHCIYSKCNKFPKVIILCKERRKKAWVSI